MMRITLTLHELSRFRIGPIAGTGSIVEYRVGSLPPGEEASSPISETATGIIGVCSRPKTARTLPGVAITQPPPTRDRLRLSCKIISANCEGATWTFGRHIHNSTHASKH